MSGMLDVRGTLDGRSLEQVMAEDGIFSLPRAAAVVGQIAGTLAAGHAVGLGHGDLHPGVIRLTSDHGGRVVARVVGIGGADEVPGGTGDLRHAMYAAPEQRQGSPPAESGDAKADQFALAAIAYEMLAGCSHLSEESSDLADPESRRRRHPPRVAEMVMGLPAAVDDVLRRALAYDPEDRFADVRDFARALADVADGQERVTPVFAPLPANRPSAPPLDRQAGRPAGKQVGGQSGNHDGGHDRSHDADDWLTPFIDEDLDGKATPLPAIGASSPSSIHEGGDWLTPFSDQDLGHQATPPPTKAEIAQATPPLAKPVFPAMTQAIAPSRPLSPGRVPPTPPSLRPPLPTIASEDPEWTTPASAFMPSIDITDIVTDEHLGNRSPAMGPAPPWPRPQALSAMPFGFGGGVMAPTLAIPKGRFGGRTRGIIVAAGVALAVAASGIVIANMGEQAPTTAAAVIPAVEHPSEPTVEPMALVVKPEKSTPVRAVAPVVARASVKKGSRANKRKVRASRHHARARHGLAHERSAHRSRGR